MNGWKKNVEENRENAERTRQQEREREREIMSRRVRSSARQMIRGQTVN